MKQLLYFTFLLTSLTTLAQNKFIEVEVRDTVTLQPVSFEYIIAIGDGITNWNEEESFNPEATTKRIKQNVEELEKLLKAKKYNFRTFQDESFEVNSIRYYDNSFIVTLQSVSELRKLKGLLSNLGFVSSSVGNVQYGNEQQAEEKLLKKLIDSAKSKAALIASYTNLKLGHILEVKEVKQIDGVTYSAMNFYFNQQQDKTLGLGNGDLTGTLSKAMVVKFAAE